MRPVRSWELDRGYATFSDLRTGEVRRRPHFTNFGEYAFLRSEDQGHNGGMDDHHAHLLHEDLTDLELEILDVLREDGQTVQLLAETLSQKDEQVGVDEVRRRLEELASYGLVRPIEESSHRDESGSDEPVLAEGPDPLWAIREEGRALVEPHTGAVHAPYDRGVSEDGVDDEREVAGLVVLLLIAFVTAACAAYSLLTAAGVLGG
jgi:hypothetical protein